MRLVQRHDDPALSDYAMLILAVIGAVEVLRQVWIWRGWWPE